MPAFWYFVSSFTFNSRLFILVWRSQLTAAQIYNERFMRRRLTWFYVAFYLTSATLVIFQNWFVYNPIGLMLFNTSLWFPQIIKNYQERSRKGPDTKFVVSLLACQCFYPLYIKLCPSNFMEIKSDLLTGSLMLSFMIFQVLMLKSQ